MGAGSLLVAADADRSGGVRASCREASNGDLAGRRADWVRSPPAPGAPAPGPAPAAPSANKPSTDSGDPRARLAGGIVVVAAGLEDGSVANNPSKAADDAATLLVDSGGRAASDAAEGTRGWVANNPSNDSGEPRGAVVGAAHGADSTSAWSDATSRFAIPCKTSSVTALKDGKRSWRPAPTSGGGALVGV